MMDRKLIATVLVSLLIGIAVGFAIGFSAEIQTFFVDYGALQNECTLLEDNYATLNDTYTALVSQYNSLQTEYNQLEQNHATLNSDHAQLNENYTYLEQNYTWLKQHSFINYTVGDSVNITSVEIEIDTWYDWTRVKGNITNVSNKAIDEVYVYALLRKPDGTIFFSSYRYDRIVDLYIGETASFEISFYDYVEGQTVEIWLVY